MAEEKQLLSDAQRCQNSKIAKAARKAAEENEGLLKEIRELRDQVDKKEAKSEELKKQSAPVKMLDEMKTLAEQYAKVCKKVKELNANQEVLQKNVDKISQELAQAEQEMRLSHNLSEPPDSAETSPCRRAALVPPQRPPALTLRSRVPRRGSVATAKPSVLTATAKAAQTVRLKPPHPPAASSAKEEPKDRASKSSPRNHGGSQSHSAHRRSCSRSRSRSHGRRPLERKLRPLPHHSRDHRSTRRTLFVNTVYLHGTFLEQEEWDEKLNEWVSWQKVAIIFALFVGSPRDPKTNFREVFEPLFRANDHYYIGAFYDDGMVLCSKRHFQDVTLEDHSSKNSALVSYAVFHCKGHQHYRNINLAVLSMKEKEGDSSEVLKESRDSNHRWMQDAFRVMEKQKVNIVQCWLEGPRTQFEGILQQVSVPTEVLTTAFRHQLTAADVLCEDKRENDNDEEALTQLQSRSIEDVFGRVRCDKDERLRPGCEWLSQPAYTVVMNPCSEVWRQTTSRSLWKSYEGPFIESFIRPTSVPDFKGTNDQTKQVREGPADYNYPRLHHVAQMKTNNQMFGLPATLQFLLEYAGD